MNHASNDASRLHRRRLLRASLAAPLVAGLAALVPATSGLATANAWTAVASLPYARSFHATATGSDGRIYAIGGEDSSFFPVATVDAYDSSTNTWSAMAPLAAGTRDAMAAATGPDGRIYVIGGVLGSGVTDVVEAYDPTGNTWTTVAPMTGGPRDFLAAATGPDGLIYAIGGLDGPAILDRVEAYDTATNSWTARAPMPGGGRELLSVATGPDGRIYAIGGSDGSSQLNRVEAYDTITDTWTTLAPMPGGGRANLAAATGADGRIYAIGGRNGGGAGLATVEAYNTGSNTWTTAQGMAAGGRTSLTAATGPDGRIYAVGGFDGTTALDRVEAYTTIGGRLTSTGISIGKTEGMPFSAVRVASFSDSDETTSPAAYTASINWGDSATTPGTIASDGAGGYSVTGSHAYVEEGWFPITVLITDLDGGSTTATATASIADASLKASGLHLKQTNHSVSGVIARFSDADPNGVTGDYTASIHWGDGTVSAGMVTISGSGFAVSATHHYHTNGARVTIRITVRDAGGSQASATTIARQ